ncbi:BCS1 N terminal family protein [Aspergillus niger]|uniref:BCS1 N terminal family protein n=1 Tax=Aspergillus niger TaxID=5061 RepID=A0A505I565_ASPNG|nr:BCS1 N terminal family protein [Aspergillus niger]
MQNSTAGLRIPAAPTFPLSSPITEEIPSPVPSSPEDHDMERNRPFAFLNKTTRRNNPFIREGSYDKHTQSQEAVDGTGVSYQANPNQEDLSNLGLYTGKSSGRPFGLSLVTDFSHSTSKAPEDGSVPTLVDLNDLKALSEVREQERNAHTLKGILKKVPGQDYDQKPGKPSVFDNKRLSYFNIRRKKKGNDDLSPSDRPIMIGLSMPSDESLSTQGRGLTVNTGHAQRAALTPSIIVTPAKEDTFWTGLDTTHPRPRIASSIYSQPTPYPDENDSDLDIPPVPAIPNYAFLAHNENPSTNMNTDSTQRQFVSAAGRQRSLSAGTLFEEDDVRRESRSRSYSSGTVKKIPDRLSINTETNRHQSQGWWTYLLSPLLSRYSTAMGPTTPTEAARPPVPSIATESRESSDEWWEKEVSSFSPDTPEAIIPHHKELSPDWTDASLNPFDEKRLSIQDQPVERERNATSFMFPGRPIQGSAAEYYQACAHELFSGRPYFECVNHVCSITPKDKIPGYTEGTVVGSSDNRSLLIDVGDMPQNEIPGLRAVPTTSEPRTVYEPSVMDKGVEATLDNLQDDDPVGKASSRGVPPSEHPTIQPPPTLRPLSEYPPTEHPPSEHPPSEHPPSEHPPSEHPPAGQPPVDNNPDQPIPDEGSRELPQEAFPTSHAGGETGELAPPPNSQSERKTSWPIFQPIIQPVVQPAPQPAPQPAIQPIIVQAPQPVAQPAPPTQTFHVHPATVPSPILIAPHGHQHPAFPQEQQTEPQPEPQPPNPTSPGLQQATVRGGSIPLSDIHTTPAPAYTSNHNSSSTPAPTYTSHYTSSMPRMEPHPLPQEGMTHTTTEREIIEIRRKTKDKDKKVKRRWYLAILTSFLIIIAIILLLVMTLTGKGDSTPVESQWLNLTGYPPMPTGIATIAGPKPQVQQSGCITPSTLWSCALPPEEQSANKPYAANEPNFRVEIRFRNGTYPNSTTIASRSSKTLSSRSSDNPYSPSPSPPSMKDQTFLGNTTDNNTVPYAGEETPFYMTFLSTSTLTSTSTLRLARRSSDSSFPNLATIIPSPDEDSDGTAAAADLYPMPSSQPVRLYNRGLNTEHYGFYTYFDRSIFLSSRAPLDGNTTDTNPNDRNGGSNESDARSGEQINSTEVKLQLEDRSYGGTLVNPAPGIFDLYGNSSTDATGDYGGVDGGSGGCSCKWANWVSSS